MATIAYDAEDERYNSVQLLGNCYTTNDTRNHPKYIRRKW